MIPHKCVCLTVVKPCHISTRMTYYSCSRFQTFQQSVSHSRDPTQPHTHSCRYNDIPLFTTNKTRQKPTTKRDIWVMWYEIFVLLDHILNCSCKHVVGVCVWVCGWDTRMFSPRLQVWLFWLGRPCSTPAPQTDSYLSQFVKRQCKAGAKEKKIVKSKRSPIK